MCASRMSEKYFWYFSVSLHALRIHFHCKSYCTELGCDKMNIGTIIRVVLLNNRILYVSSNGFSFGMKCLVGIVLCRYQQPWINRWYVYGYVIFYVDITVMSDDLWCLSADCFVEYLLQQLFSLVWHKTIMSSSTAARLKIINYII